MRLVYLPVRNRFCGRVKGQATKKLNDQNNSSPDAEDRQLIVPVAVVLVAVAEPLGPSVVAEVGERLFRFPASRLARRRELF
jgi:hypothetical protein